MSNALFNGDSCTVLSDTGVVREYFPVGDTWVSDEIFPFVADTVQTRVMADGKTVTMQPQTYTRSVTY